MQIAIQPTPRELEILKALWDHGPSGVREVYQILAEAQDEDLAYNTVQTLLRIMEDKGLVKHHVEGRAFTIVTFAVCSTIYRWFIMIAITTMVWKFLDPYGWGVIGAVMALGCIYNALIAPLWKFAKFMTTPQMAAHWSIESGYVAVNKNSYDLPEMKTFLQKFPQMTVARDQLEYAYPKMMAVNYQLIRNAMTTNLDAAIEGKKSPGDALATAHKLMEQAIKGQ